MGAAVPQFPQGMLLATLAVAIRQNTHVRGRMVTVCTHRCSLCGRPAAALSTWSNSGVLCPPLPQVAGVVPSLRGVCEMLGLPNDLNLLHYHLLECGMIAWHLVPECARVSRRPRHTHISRHKPLWVVICSFLNGATMLTFSANKTFLPIPTRCCCVRSADPDPEPFRGSFATQIYEDEPDLNWDLYTLLEKFFR